MRSTNIIPVPKYMDSTNVNRAVSQYAQELATWLEHFNRTVYEDINWTTGVWDDEKAPVTAIRVGGASPAQWTDYLSSQVLDFTDSKDQSIQFVAQIPHSVKQESEIEFHIHIAPLADTSGTSKWTFTYAPANIGSEFPATAYDMTGSIDISANRADFHIMSSFGKLAEFTNTTVSSILLCSLTREAGEAADTYENDIHLLSLDFHIEKDSNGSKTEDEK